MKRRQLVSIVTPCRNPGDLLRACIDSVRAQSYAQVEHVIVDAASTDGTKEFLEATDLKWVSEPDEGQSDALNKGFAMASGELLGWLGADDLLFPGSIEATAEALARTGAGLAYGAVEFREPQRRYVLKPPRRLKSSSFDMFNPIWQPGTLFTRQAFETVGGIDSSFHLAMDFDLWLRMLDAGVVSTYVPRVLAAYVLHDLSKTGSLGRDAFILEMVKSYLKTGRTRQASLALGRAAANRAAGGEGVARAAIEERLEELFLQYCEVFDVNKSMAEAGAKAEAAVLEFQHSWRGARHLLDIGPWLYSATRRRLLLAARRGILRGRL